MTVTALSEGGFFNGTLTFPTDYPMSPPTMKFTTKIWHPNVYEDGRVCISILHPPGDDEYGYEKASERWNPIHTVESIILSVITMLASPNDESPANIDVSGSNLVARFAHFYRRWCGIHRYGLQYEDVLAENKVVDEALRRMPYQELEARDQRLKRAFDLSHKKDYLPEAEQPDPLHQTFRLRQLRNEVQNEFDERAIFRK